MIKLLQNYYLQYINDLAAARIFNKILNKQISINLPVVNAGVQSCSPVAPQINAKLFDGSTAGPAAECKAVFFLLSKKKFKKK